MPRFLVNTYYWVVISYLTLTNYAMFSYNKTVYIIFGIFYNCYSVCNIIYLTNLCFLLIWAKGTLSAMLYTVYAIQKKKKERIPPLSTVWFIIDCVTTRGTRAFRVKADDKTTSIDMAQHLLCGTYDEK